MDVCQISSGNWTEGILRNSTVLNLFYGYISLLIVNASMAAFHRSVGTILITSIFTAYVFFLIPFILGMSFFGLFLVSSLNERNKIHDV